jgi:hypothetical protein
MSARQIVLITGAARSGTSMVAGVLHACGLNLGGPLVGPTEWNPRGFFEHRPIRQKVIKPLLRELGCDHRGQGKLPPRGVMVPPARINRPRKQINVRLNGGQGYKDAKLLLLWPIFRRAFPNARWVLVRRDPKEIVDSCIRTPFMKKRQFKAGWIEWVQEHEFRMNDLKESGANVCEIWPDPHEPECFREAVEFCGLRWDQSAVRSRLVPDAWHERRAG